METHIIPLIRSNIQSLVAYSSARKESEVTPVKLIQLDANERPFGHWCRYPDPQPSVLVRGLAQMYSHETGEPLAEESVLVTRGSDEAIDVIVRTFCEAREDAVLITSPTYGMYKVSADIQGIAVVNVPLLHSESGFEIDTEGVIAAASDPHKHIKLVFVCSPNNPTGQLIDRAAVKKIASSLLGKAMVVVDEAYVEFSPAGATLLTELKHHPNLIVTRTLSKAFGMAAARLGCAIADPRLVQGFFCKVIAPYPIPGPVVDEVAKILNNPGEIEKTRRETAEIVARRDRLSEALRTVPCVRLVYPADSNFILFKVDNAAEAMRITKAQGVVLRDRSKDYGLANHLRITTGTEDEVQAALAALRLVPKA